MIRIIAAAISSLCIANFNHTKYIRTQHILCQNIELNIRPLDSLQRKGSIMISDEQRLEILKSLINQYNFVLFNTPKAMSNEMQTYVLTCITCRMNEILIPYESNSDNYMCLGRENRIMIVSAINMLDVIKKSINVSSHSELMDAMNTKHKSIVGPQKSKIVILKRQHSNGMSASAKAYTPRI